MINHPANKCTIPDSHTRHMFRPLVDTFKMYLCADTATFCQMYLCTDTIQYQYFSKVSDTDTFSINFWPYFQFLLRFYVTMSEKMEILQFFFPKISNVKYFQQNQE